MRMKWTAASLWLALAMALGVSGCGFKLRGQESLPFASAWVQASDKSPMATALRQRLTSQGKLAAARDQAEIVILLGDDKYTKSILSLSGGGKVREYRLEQKAMLSVSTPDGRELLVPGGLQVTRDFSYSDAEMLAKEGEEALLRKDMENDLLRQLMRRLSFARP